MPKAIDLQVILPSSFYNVKVGGFGRGQFHGENFYLEVGAGIVPMKCFAPFGAFLASPPPQLGRRRQNLGFMQRDVVAQVMYAINNGGGLITPFI